MIFDDLGSGFGRKLMGGDGYGKKFERKLKGGKHFKGVL